jgi:subtilisin family serine protease
MSAAVAVLSVGVYGQDATGQGLQTNAAQIQALQVAAAQGLDYVPGEVVFKFKKGTMPALQQRALTAIRSRPRLGDVRWSHDIGLIHDDTQPDSRVLAAQLREQGEVEFAEPNYIRTTGPVARSRSTQHIAADATSPGAAAKAATAAAFAPVRSVFVPNDPLFAIQWNFPLATVTTAWNTNPGGSSSVIVAVIDTGVTVQSQTLTAPLWTGSSFTQAQLKFAKSPDISASKFTGARDFVFTTNNNVLDLNGHGTHISSTITEDTNNGITLAGIAFNVKLMPMKVCVGYWETMIARGAAGVPGFAKGIGFDNGVVQCPSSAVSSAIMTAADAGARVINISLGGDQPSQSEQDAINYAVGKGAFVAIAMGNSFANGNPTEYPASYAIGIDGAMSVAAVTSGSSHASYSSSGSYCEISAPGGDAPTTNVVNIDPFFVWQNGLVFDDSDETLVTIPRFDEYDIIGFTGTSSASPHVAALAALLMSQYPKITPAQVETIIKATALHLGAAKGRDDQFGFGLIQAGRAILGVGIAK